MHEKYEMNQLQSSSRRNTNFLIAILLLSVLLRFFAIGYESLWYDEGSSYYGITQGYEFAIEHSARNNQPPLYLLLLKTWSLVFGVSEAALRGMSALFGVVAVWLAFLIGRRMRNTEAGLFLAFLFAVSRFMIEFSQETRNYSLLTMNAMAAALFMLKWMDTKTKGSFLLFLLFSVLTVYSHIYGWFFFLAVDLFLFYRWIRRKDALRSLVILNCTVLLSFLPWLFTLASQVSHYIDLPLLLERKTINADVPHWLKPPDISVVRYVFSYFGGTFLVFQLFSALILLHFVLIFKDRERRDARMVFLLVWVFCALLIPMIISWTLTPMFQLRYAILAGAGFLLLSGIAIHDLIARIAGDAARRGLYGLVILFVLVNLWPAYDDHYKIFRGEHRKEQWREAAGYVRAHLGSDTAVLLNVKKLIYPFGYYFREKSVPLYGADTVTDMRSQSAIGEHGRLVVVFSHNDGQGKGDSVTVWLERYGAVESSTNLNGIKVVVYKKD